MPSLFDPHLFWQNREAILAGAGMTLVLGGASVILSLVFGLAGWLLKASRTRALSWIGIAYVEGMRNTPTLIYLYLIYFGLTTVGITLSPFLAALLALSVQSGAYMAEILRGGFSAIGEPQLQAARALGLRPWTSLVYVEVPQVLRVAFPALGNQVVSLLLTTSLASVIAVPELTYQSQVIGSLTYQYFGVFGIDAIIYIVIVQLVDILWRSIEHAWFAKWKGTV